MKPTFLLLLTGLCLMLNGCAMMSREDQDFYGRGWLHPKDLDDENWKPKRRPTDAPVTAPGSL